MVYTYYTIYMYTNDLDLHIPYVGKYVQVIITNRVNQYIFQLRYIPMFPYILINIIM